MPLAKNPPLTPLNASSDASSNNRPSIGTLYGLGVGPGDPELLTLKALKRLKSAPVVAFPAGIKGNPGVAEQIISPWLSESQTRLPLTFPYVLDTQQLATAWEKAAEMVWPYLQQGDVAFACEGDVSFYGTFTYLAQHLQKQHPNVKIETVAGVSSPMAAAAALGIPLTCQAEKLAILPALYSFEANQATALSESSTELTELEKALEWADVVVLMKVGSVYRQVWEILSRRQLLGHSYVVEKATRTDQKIFRGLQNCPDLQLPYFSLLIVQQTHRKVL